METTAENSRSANRMNPTKDTAMVHGLSDAPMPAAVIDESFGGIGIAVPLRLAEVQELGVEITVEYGGVSCVALIRHVAPLPSGCRLGLEWKAQALSRCLRDLLKVQNNVESLLRILPGGLSMMWKLYEAERWTVLLDSADRLRRQLSTCDVTELAEPIRRFQDVVRQVADTGDDSALDSKELVKTELDLLIRECIAVIN